MCGFAGFLQPFGFIAEAGEAVAQRMTRVLDHRGPDHEGVWVDAEAGVAMGHRRLSILDLSPAGNQPMVSRSGRWVIAFNGEIYNHLALRQALDKAGFDGAWCGHSDTETLLAAIEAWGIEKTLMSVVGMFSVALWDRMRREMCLMRDRVGEKPLYYGWAGNALAFGSELKALRAHPSWQGEVDRDVLALFARHSYVPAPFSIYKDVWKLLPGTSLTVSAHDVRQRRLSVPRAYWSVVTVAARGREQPFAGGDSAALAELERLCGEAVSLQRVSDVPLGAFLSGGVDSSAVVAVMQAQSSRPVRTFTIGFAESEYNEAGYAKAVARHLGTDHTELYVQPGDAQVVIPRLPQIYDEPFADASQIPTFLVAQLARQHVTVSLSGDAGDELFGGYNRYVVACELRRRFMWLPIALRRRLASAITVFPPRVLSALLAPLGWIMPRLRVSEPGEKLIKFAEILKLEGNDSLYRSLISQWSDPASLVLGATEPATQLDNAELRGSVASTFEEWMMTMDTLTYLPDCILAKVDRAAMSVSLETRVPFLDHRLVEFALSLPLRMKIRDGQGKWLLRQMLYTYVPRELIDRPKMGFGVPIGSWLRGPLRPWAEALLDESRLRREGYLDPVPIRRAWQEHQDRRQNWQYKLWNVLMFQAWLAAEHA